MQVSKNDIVHGLMHYMSDDVINVVDNCGLKFILTTSMSAIEVNPKLIDSFFNNPLLRTTLNATDNGDYFDIDSAERILSKSIREVGELKIEIPAVPILMPKTQELIFHQNDVEKLFACIRGEV